MMRIRKLEREEGEVEEEGLIIKKLNEKERNKT